MNKLIFTGLIALMAGNALAEITCLAEKGRETVEVRVIDTFIDRMAFITRTHPSIRFPVLSVSVKAFEKSKSVSFVNSDEDFHLSVDKINYQRSLPPLYKAEFSFKDLASEMDCIIE